MKLKGRRRLPKSRRLWILAFVWAVPAWGYETAPRITDREIVEVLTELKAGQQAINQRIDDLRSTTLTLFSVLIGMMAAFVGFVLWDRRSMLKSVQSQMEGVLAALRELAKKDAQVAGILRAYGLL
ncbi:MAG: hypothetical protein B1H02_02700 [Candidatus Latescibacteria bacterium 4484_107]|nr:MAG: hypothetical protein B1H02_02700 [Candidatus Latescibacteria bacterium 4484_107]